MKISLCHPIVRARTSTTADSICSAKTFSCPIEGNNFNDSSWGRTSLTSSDVKTTFYYLIMAARTSMTADEERPLLTHHFLCTDHLFYSIMRERAPAASDYERTSLISSPLVVLSHLIPQTVRTSTTHNGRTSLICSYAQTSCCLDPSWERERMPMKADWPSDWQIRLASQCPPLHLRAQIFSCLIPSWERERKQQLTPLLVRRPPIVLSYLIP